MNDEANALTTSIGQVSDSEDSMVEVKKRIGEAVFHLLMTDTTKLYNILYRIDLEEEKVKQVFKDNPTVEEATERLTGLIIERQLLKIEIRKKYTS